MLVEAYVDRLSSAAAAVRNGAGRLELCGPGEGGLTPSPDLVRAVLDMTVERAGGRVPPVPVHAMVRPRTGDFVYTDAEFAEMERVVDRLKAAGCAGVVLGISCADGTLDLPRMRALITRARPLRVGIHRAFDRTPDADAALDQVIALGVDVVLAAGHAPTAEEGIATLSRLVRRAAGRTVIMPGGGVRAHNVRRIVRETGATEVHARAAEPEVFADLVRTALRPD